jgi:hypothetical protein
MSDGKICPMCGAILPIDAPAGICPKCLLAAGLAGETSVREDFSDEVPTTPLPSSSRFVPPAPQELTRLFPQLEMVELIGAGGMGAVYKARQLGLDRLVAVKILPPEVGADPSFAQRFTREAQALARLSHQHIVTVYDFGVTGGLYYFIMEYVDGANLRQLIRSGELQPPQALAIVPQICEALQFAHDEGVVHRDIKPENILVDKRGRVKIADFGLARLLGSAGPDVSLTDTNQVLGTFHYMAPEQLQGSRAIDHRADIYSLGVVFYEMLTGELPLGRFAPPSKKVQVDVRLDEVVLRSLETEPERRYQRASDVKTDVEAISDSSPPIWTDPITGFTAEEDALFAAARRRVRWPATLLAVLGIISLVVLAAAVFPLLRLGDDGPLSSTPRQLVVGIGTTLVALCGIQLIMVVGAVKTFRLSSYIWAVAASLMALIPSPGTWPFWFLTLPIGIWSLILLNKPDVKQGFELHKRLATRKRIAPYGAEVPQPPRPHVGNESIALAASAKNVEQNAAVVPEFNLDPDEQQRTAELAEIAPDWLAYAAMGLLALGWVFVGLMWNLRHAGVAIAIFVMAAITYGVVRWKLVYLPKLRLELARLPNWKMSTNLVIALLWFVLGIVCVIGGQVSTADLMMKPPHFTFSDMATVRAQGALRLAHFDGLSDVNSRLWMQGGRFDPVPWSGVMMSWLAGILLVFTAVATVIHTRRYRYTWKHWWAPSLSVVIALLTTLMLTHFAHLVLVGHGTSNPKQRDIHFTAPRDLVDTAIDRWAAEKDYLELSFQNWDIAQDGSGVGRVQVRHLHPRSWFDRYRASWKYMFLRPHPPLYITVVTRDKPADAYVRIELPSHTKGSPEEAMWSMLVDELEARIRSVAMVERMPTSPE